MDGVSRRRFLGAAVDAATLTALTGALRPLQAFAARGGGAPVLFDPRFPTARIAASRLAGVGELLAVSADPSDLLPALRGPQDRAQSWSLRGVTPESVPFCLEQLLARHGRPVLSVKRLDQDLFIWKLEVPA